MLQITTQSAHGLQLSEFRDHVGIGYTDDDPALQRALDAAVVFWERSTNHYIRDTTATVDWWSTTEPVPLGGGTVALSSVVRLDPDGSTTTTVTSDWYLTRTMGSFSVQLVQGGNFRNEERYTGTFTVTADAIDPTAKSAIYAIANHLFTYRSVGEEVAVQTVPFSVRAIVGMFSKGTM
jgi:uncharacterized phiE125 gp8 family phage protein